MTIVDFILAYCWIRIRCYPDTGEIVAVNSILDKLSKTVLVDVNAACLTVMNFALDDCWICSSFHLKSSYSIVMNVILFKVSLKLYVQF